MYLIVNLLVMSSIGRIKEFLKVSNITQEEFTKSIGKSRGYLSSTKELSMDTVRDIVRLYPNLSIDWLISGSGEMTIKDSSEDEVSNSTRKMVLQRLDELMTNAGITINQLSKEINIPQTTLNDAIKGGKDFKLNMLLAICRYFDVSLDWLSGNSNEKPTEEGKHIIKYVTNYTTTMGNNQFLDNGEIENYKEIHLPNFNDCEYAIDAFGDSMTPKIKSGQVVLIKQWKESFIDWGKIYLIVTKNGYRTIKYVMPSVNNDCITCVSENAESNPPFEIKKEDIHTMFLVKGWICKEAI